MRQRKPIALPQRIGEIMSEEIKFTEEYTEEELLKMLLKYQKNRDLDSIPIEGTKFFEGSEAHHIDTKHVIYIPKELHRSVHHNVFTGKNMDIINELAKNFLENYEEEKNNTIKDQRIIEMKREHQKEYQRKWRRNHQNYYKNYYKKHYGYSNHINSISQLNNIKKVLKFFQKSIAILKKSV